MEVKPTLGQWLKQRRRILGMTQAELAQKINCSKISIRKIEADERKPSKQVASLMAEVLNIPTQERVAFIHFARSQHAEFPANIASPQENLASEPFSGRVLQNPVIDTRLPALPAARTSYVGREQEHARLDDLFFTVGARLVTLVGAPGVGKTRLALETGRRLESHFLGGTGFVALATIRDSTQVGWAMAQSLGVSGTSEDRFLGNLISFIQNRSILLILDNFEHVLDGATLVAELLTACSGLKILTTSREPLRIYGEHEFQVLPLALPDYKSLAFSSGDPASVLVQFPSIHLFIQRCQAIRPSFQLSSENARPVAEICQRLDGLPLAIELAAARIKMVSPVAMLVQLENRFQFLSKSMRDFNSRHQTLSASIDWSYRLLSPQEQQLLDRLAVFQGSFTVEGVQAVCLSPEYMSIQPFDASMPEDDLLYSLVEKSLVQALPDGEHFVLLETIRDYASAQLGARAEVERLKTAHARYFLELVAKAEPHFYGPQAVAWMDRLDDNYVNLRAAFTWAFDGGPVEQGLHAAASLLFYWIRRSTFSEAYHWLDTAVKKLNPDRPDARNAEVLINFGAIGYFVGRGARHVDSLKQAEILCGTLGDQHNLALAYFWLSLVSNLDYLERSVALFRQIGDLWWLAFSLWLQSSQFIFSGVYYPGAESVVESEQLFRQLGDPYGLSYTHLAHARLEMAAGNMETARTHLEKGLALKQALVDKWGTYQALKDLGELTFVTAGSCEDFDHAKSYLESAIAGFRDLGARHTELVYAMHRLGNVVAASGDNERANELYQQVLHLCREYQYDMKGTASFLVGPAQMALYTGDSVRAVQLLAAIVAMNPNFPTPIDRAGKMIFDQVRAAAESSLQKDDFQRAWEQGRKLSVDEAIEHGWSIKGHRAHITSCGPVR
jgi:predicted ATPase/DNA-binding XRE family transcriptional regulator